MMSGDTATEHRVRRILTLIDASRPSQAALQAAVELAVRRHAELLALYVEDVDLLRSAAFPFSSELGAVTGRRRPMDTESVERLLQRQGQRVSDVLRKAVQGKSLRHSLRVTRGKVVTETLAVVGADDLLVLGKTGASAAFGPGMGSTCRALIMQAPCPVLVWDQSRTLRPGPVLLAAEKDEPESRGKAWRLQALIEWLEEQGIATGIRRFPPMQPSWLLQEASRQRGGALILTRSFLGKLREEDRRSLDRLTLPVLVMS